MNSNRRLAPRRSTAHSTDLPIAANKSILGSRNFTRESGIGVDLVVKTPLAMFGTHPALTGRAGEVVLGKKSGKASITYNLEKLGYGRFARFHFDSLVRNLSTSGTRRGLLRLLATLPIAGALLAALAQASEAGRRGKRNDRPGHRPRQHDETPRQLVLELNAEGTDYFVRGDVVEEEFREHWEQLRMVLEDADDKRTRQELLKEWPADFDRPNPGTLWRWLQRAVGLGLVRQDGTGRKHAPFRYWLPGQEEKWLRDPLYRMRLVQEEVQERLRQMQHGAARGEG